MGSVPHSLLDVWSSGNRGRGRGRRLLKDSCSPSLPSTVKSHITSLVSAVETVNARNTVLEKENQGVRDASEARKRKRAGIIVGNLGTHVFSTEDCLERVRVAEAVTTARKTKGKERRYQWVPNTPLMMSTPS